jgi:diguanylate cyclase (GGDEF)-like protein
MQAGTENGASGVANPGDGTRIDDAVDAWAADGARLDEASRRAVVAAVVHALDGGRAGGWLDALYRFDPTLDIDIEDARALRGVLHEQLVAPRPPTEALELQLRLNLLVDELIDAAAERRVRTLEQTALVDPLTSLLNRRAFDAAFASALAHGRRHGRPVALAMVDLDGLKRINDTMGHAAGDDALRAFSSAITHGLRAGDDAFRIGGDEFVVLAPDTTAADLDSVMRRIATNAPSFSVGIAELPDDGDDAATILSVADARLYGTRRVVAAGARPHLLDRLAVGLIALVLAGVAAVVAEGVRHVIGVDAHGATAAAWQTILVAAPISCALVAGSRGQASAVDALRRGTALAGVSLLMMIAAMTPLFVRTADPEGRRQKLASEPRPTPPATTTTTDAPVESTTSTTAVPRTRTTPTTVASHPASSSGVPTAIVLRPGQITLPPVTTGGTPTTPVTPTPTTPGTSTPGTSTPVPTPTPIVHKPLPTPLPQLPEPAVVPPPATAKAKVKHDCPPATVRSKRGRGRDGQAVRCLPTPRHRLPRWNRGRAA